jgi:hypothetical protein
LSILFGPTWFGDDAGVGPCPRCRRRKVGAHLICCQLVVIKVFFSVLVLCTVAVVVVVLAVHFRVKRHLSREHIDAQVRPVIEDAAEEAAQTQSEDRPKWSP